MKYLLILLILVGCATKPDAIVPPPEKYVHIDPRILEPCENLIELPPDTSTFEDLLKITLVNFEIYSDCALKHRNSTILLKKFANKEE